MSEISFFIDKIVELIISDYTLLLSILLLSFFCFHAGYFLIIFGTSRKISVFDVLRGNFRKGIYWNYQSIIGVFLNLVSRITFPLYFIFAGSNSSLVDYLFWGIIMIITVFFLLKKLLFAAPHEFESDVEVVKKTLITIDERDKMWSIYNAAFEPLNKKSPCKQSMEFEHFKGAMLDEAVLKFVIQRKNDGVIAGFSLITNSFDHTPWISEEYFKYHYAEKYAKKLVYYFIGISISPNFRGNGYAIPLVEYTIDQLPKDVVIGFDHSFNINPKLHFFTRVIKQAKFIKRTHIDRQHYHVVEYKK